MKRRGPLRLAAVLACFVGCAQAAAQRPSDSVRWGLIAVEGVRVGQVTLEERPTGCTVVLLEGLGAVGGVDVRGGAPGTRETDLLDPVNMVERVNGVVLSGGSAFGLDVATGVMRYLEERGVGFHVGRHVVPIVPAAILFDLGIGDATVRPDASCGYDAASAATSGPITEGSVGAGAGATVGKLGHGRPMRGGLGTASIMQESGLIVAALVAVNAVGDVVDPQTGAVVAGALTEDGDFADARVLLRQERLREPESGSSTTIGVVATNAILTKAEATKVAQMAQDGLARAIYPAHTSSDGDTVYALATGSYEGSTSVTTIGARAADVMAQAILRAVREATGLPDIPSVRDLVGR